MDGESERGREKQRGGGGESSANVSEATMTMITTFVVVGFITGSKRVRERENP